MKRKKTPQQKITEITYGRRDLRRKLGIVESSIKEVQKILNDKK